MNLLPTEEAPPLVDGFRYKRRIKPGVCCVYHCNRKARAVMKNGSRSYMCSKHAMERWRKANPMRAAYGQVRDSARRRDIPFSLTLDEFREAIKNTQYLNSKGVNTWNYHLDRKESDKGYYFENIRVITASENCAKSHAAHERRKANKRRALAGQKEWADDATLLFWAAEIGAKLKEDMFGECSRCNGAHIWAQVFILSDGARCCECCLPEEVNAFREIKAETEANQYYEEEESDWIDDSQFA